MPIHEFKCRRCGNKFDELVKLGEIPPCPSCGDKKPEQLFSTSAAISTPSSREKSAGQARRKAGAVRKEQKHAQAEYERNYIKEHSE